MNKPLSPPVRFEVRIPPDLNEQLERLADEGYRSKNAQIIKLLREALKEAS